MVLGVVLAVYVLAALLVNPFGHLSNDVAGKTASVAAMAATSGDPDLSYWFEDADPQGDFFPFRNTRVTETGTWINSTSLTMLLPAAPLWSWFGPRGILVLPMLGALAAAAAAGAVARRVDPTSDGTIATLWIGLASPVLIYAVDFWEHTWGAALIVGGMVLLYDTLTDDRVLRSLGAGAMLGLAATMRQEALVYAFVGGLTIGGVYVARRQLSMLAKAGFAYVAGFVVPFLSYGLIEAAMIGGTSARSDRGLTTLQSSGSLLGARITSSLTWLLAPIGSSEPLALVMGCILVASAAAFAAWLFTHSPGAEPGFAKKAMIVTWVAWLIGIPLLKPG